MSTVLCLCRCGQAVLAACRRVQHCSVGIVHTVMPLLAHAQSAGFCLESIVHRIKLFQPPNVPFSTDVPFSTVLETSTDAGWLCQCRPTEQPSNTRQTVQTALTARPKSTSSQFTSSAVALKLSFLKSPNSFCPSYFNLKF